MITSIDAGKGLFKNPISFNDKNTILCKKIKGIKIRKNEENQSIWRWNCLYIENNEKHRKTY